MAGWRLLGRSILLASCFLLLLISAAKVQPQREEGSASAGLYLPSPETLRVLGLGFQDIVADALWLMVAQEVGAKVGQDNTLSDSGKVWRTGVVHYLDLATLIDPDWRTMFYNGGPILELLGRSDAAILLNLRALQTFDKDWYFPFQIAMNYLESGNAARAELFMTLAAEKGRDQPSAPRHLSRLAATLNLEQGRGQMALALLEEQLEHIEFPKVREQIQIKISEVRLCVGRAILRQALKDGLLWENRALLQPQELLSHGFLQSVPLCPFGGQWFWDPEETQFHCSRFDEEHRSMMRKSGLEEEEASEAVLCP